MALVVSVPIPLRTQQTGVPTRRKAFLRNYGKQKSANEHLTQTRYQKKVVIPRKMRYNEQAIEIWQKNHLKRGEIMDSSGSRSTDMVFQQLQNAGAIRLSVV